MKQSTIASNVLLTAIVYWASAAHAVGQPPLGNQIAVIDLEKVFQQSKNYREMDQQQRHELHETEQAILHWDEKAENHRRLVVSLVPSSTGSDRTDKEWYLRRARQRFAWQQQQLERILLAELKPILREISEQRQIGVVLNLHSSTYNGRKPDEQQLLPSLIIHHNPPLDITELVGQRLHEAEEKRRAGRMTAK